MLKNVNRVEVRRVDRKEPVHVGESSDARAIERIVSELRRQRVPPSAGERLYALKFFSRGDEPAVEILVYSDGQWWQSDQWMGQSEGLVESIDAALATEGGKSDVQ